MTQHIVQGVTAPRSKPTLGAALLLAGILSVPAFLFAVIEFAL